MTQPRYAVVKEEVGPMGDGLVSGPLAHPPQPAGELVTGKTHIVHVQDREVGYAATCCCGWSGPEAASRDRADHDAYDHVDRSRRRDASVLRGVGTRDRTPQAALRTLRAGNSLARRGIAPPRSRTRRSDLDEHSLSDVLTLGSTCVVSCHCGWSLELDDSRSALLDAWAAHVHGP